MMDVWHSKSNSLLQHAGETSRDCRHVLSVNEISGVSWCPWAWKLFGRLKSNHSFIFLLESMALAHHVNKLFLMDSRPFELFPTRQFNGSVVFA